MRKVSHRNIIGLRGLYEDADNVYLVCELATGGELFDQIVAKGYFTEADAAHIIRELLEALDYIHSLGTLFLIYIQKLKKELTY